MSKSPVSPRKPQRCGGCGQRKACRFSTAGYVCEACRAELAVVTANMKAMRAPSPTPTRYGRVIESRANAKYK